eukprot:1149527-Pelagomonas_calceolata.AAC.1
MSCLANLPNFEQKLKTTARDNTSSAWGTLMWAIHHSLICCYVYVLVGLCWQQGHNCSYIQRKTLIPCHMQCSAVTAAVGHVSVRFLKETESPLVMVSCRNVCIMWVSKAKERKKVYASQEAACIK